MSTEKTIFVQLLSFFLRHEFDKCVARYDGDHWVRTFTCWEQFIVMCLAQLTYRESLRDIETCLHTMQSKLYHVGLRSKIAVAPSPIRMNQATGIFSPTSAII